MLLLLQIILFICFLVTLVQVIFDFLHGTLLIVSGLLLIAIGYSLKLISRIRLLCRNIHLGRRHRDAIPFRFIRF